MAKHNKKHGRSTMKNRVQAAVDRRTQASQLTDEELLVKLRSFDIEIDRASLEHLCDKNCSAEQIARHCIDHATKPDKPVQPDTDWIRVCLAQLWQRWYPDKPFFEKFDDGIQAGYRLLLTNNVVPACRIWLDAWTALLSLFDKSGIESIDEFDRQFMGSEWVWNWIQDLEQELWNVGLLDPQFLRARISVCEEALRRFASADNLMAENWRNALAESYFEIGETGKAEALFTEWLHADPQWGWGWIGWSDLYHFARSPMKDLKRAEQILLNALSIAEVRDFDHLIERLAILYEDQGRVEEAQEVRQRASRPEAIWPKVNPPKVNGPKVGRNDPCSCGSGKKFKKCCGGSG